MILLTPIDTSHPHYYFVEQLLHTAFPRNERRDDDKQRLNTDTNLKFNCLLVETEPGQPVGLITYWRFQDFAYIEHFAIDIEHRRQGYGAEALASLLEEINLPVVLEVEIPQRSRDTAFRRINFYKRMGFHLRRTNYSQPPYRKEDDWLPMKLMTYGELNVTDRIVNTLRREVYGVK